MTDPELSLVLPCYNEAGNIPALVDGYRSTARRMRLELILVDNGSTDGSAEVLRAELSRPENSFARSVRVAENKGYGHGLIVGLSESRAPVVGVSHADLQYDPGEALKAYDFYRRQGPESPRLVKGRRVGYRPLPDRMVTWAYNRLASWVLGLRARPLTGGGEPRPVDVNAEPKIFDRALLGALNGAPSDFTFDLYLLHAAKRRGYSLFEFDAAYGARQWGKSKLAANPWMRVKTASRAFAKIFALRLFD